MPGLALIFCGFMPLVTAAEAEPLVRAHQQKIESLQAEIKRIEQEEPLAKRVAELKAEIESKSKLIQEPFKAVYPSQHRSVFLMTQRILRHPYLALFDGPDCNYSTDTRTSATVPLQALFMMNNPFVLEQSRGFAQRLIAASPDARRRIELAHELAWSRPPRPIEVDRARVSGPLPARAGPRRARDRPN